MLTDFQPNHQAYSLHTETKVSHLQVEPLDDRQLNTSEESNALEFDYLTDFGGDQALISEAKAVSKSFIFFLRRTFKDLTTLGNELWGVSNKCMDTLGTTEGKRKFNRWLDAEFRNSQHLARTAMSLSQWYNNLKPAMQRLVAKNVKDWSVAAVKKLTSLPDELVAVLLKSGKQTLKSIERAIATSLANELNPLPAVEGDRSVTPSDWSSLRKKFNLRPRHIKVLKEKAESLASTPVVKVSHVNEAIAQCKEDPEILSQPAKKAKKKKTDRSTPAESPLRDNSDEAITELITSAIASDMEKEQAANFETSAKLQQALAEKDATIAAQKKPINSAITGEQEKATRAHSQQMESLRQALEAQSPPVERMYTQEQLDEAIARDRSLRKGAVYTEEDVKEKIADACKNMYTDEEVQEEIEFELRKERISLKKEMYTEKQVEAKLAEALAEMQESVDTAYAEKLASLQQALEEKDRTIASLEKQKEIAAAEKLASLQQELASKEQALASMSEETAAAVAQARAEEREKTASEMASQITSLQQTMASLQQTLAEKDKAIASLEEQKAAAETEKFVSLEKELAEKDKVIASLEEQKAVAVEEARALMEKEKKTAITHARTDEREKMKSTYTEAIALLEKKLAERNSAIASILERQAEAVAEARADEQAIACVDMDMLQMEMENLKAQNNLLMATREQLVTATAQIEKLKSQLTDSEKKYSEKVRWLEAGFNSVTKRNQDSEEIIKRLESANKSMHHKNRSLKDELASYKNISRKIELNYYKINQAENLLKENAKLKEDNARLKENLQGQMDKLVLLASRVTLLNEALNEVSYMQRTMASLKIPGFENNGKKYVSPLDGQIYQGIQGLAKFFQDLVNNNFNLGTS